MPKKSIDCPNSTISDRIATLKGYHTIRQRLLTIIPLCPSTKWMGVTQYNPMSTDLREAQITCHTPSLDISAPLEAVLSLMQTRLSFQPSLTHLMGRVRVAINMNIEEYRSQP